MAPPLGEPTCDAREALQFFGSAMVELHYNRRAFTASLASLLLCPISVGHGQQLERSSLKLGVAGKGATWFPRCNGGMISQSRCGPGPPSSWRERSPSGNATIGATTQRTSGASCSERVSAKYSPSRLGHPGQRHFPKSPPGHWNLRHWPMCPEQYLETR